MSPVVAHTSEVIAELAGEADVNLTVRGILTILGDRIYALLIVALGILNCLPMPPFLPIIFGLLLAFIALQLTLGRTTPWLPQALLDRKIARKDVTRVSQRVVPLFQRLERYTRPRLMVFVEPIAHRIIGILVLLLAIALVCAPPVIGQIPIGFAICLIGLGLVERDGLIVFGGLMIGCVGASISFSFVYALIAGVGALF